MQKSSEVDWGSEHYRRIIEDQRRWLYNWDWLEWVFQGHIGIGSAERALDVGCGTGFLSFELARMNPSLEITAVDTNDDLLNTARAKCASLGLNSRMKLEHCDCCELPYPDASFDLVGAHTLLLHLDSPETALREMARVAEPGCVVFACEPDNFASFPAGFESATEEDGVDFEWARKRFDYASKLYQGKIKLGEGDSAIARRLTLLFADAGLDVFFFRKSDRCLFLSPPYDTDEKAKLRDNLKITLSEESARKFLPTLRNEFIAGGGTEKDFDAFWAERFSRQKLALDALREEKLTWISNHTLAICAGRKQDLRG